MTLGGTRLLPTALALGFTASRLTHSCAYPCLAGLFFLPGVAPWDSRGRLSPHKCEVEGGVLPKLACSSNRASSSSLDDSGHELQQRRCGRAALLGPHSGAHERWPSGPVHG